MAVVRIIEQPRAVVIVRGQAGEVVKVEAAGPPAVVKVMSEGAQGPPGPSFDIFTLPLAPAN